MTKINWSWMCGLIYFSVFFLSFTTIGSFPCSWDVQTLPGRHLVQKQALLYCALSDHKPLSRVHENSEDKAKHVVELEADTGLLKKITAVGKWKSTTQVNLKVYPPPTLEEYLYDRSTLCPAHMEQILQLWCMIKTSGSIRKFQCSENILIVEALSMAYITFREEKSRQEFEDLINSAIGTAAVLGELRSDITTILAGLLHEVVNIVSTNSTLSVHLTKLIGRFGQDTVHLALRYNKIPFFAYKENKSLQYDGLQAENQMQMLVVQAEDYRLLYIRIAERLHAMRMIRKLPLSDIERSMIAMEARHVYAPLAHKMGEMKVRGELEDLSFRILEPSMFQVTRYTQTAASKAYQDAAERIVDFIHTDAILLRKKAHIRLTHRIKGKYQLYLKSVRKGLKSPNDVRDVLGLRIVVDIPRYEDESVNEHCDRSTALCYYVVERLRHMPGWEPTPHGFKDYILHTKASGYQSLHQYIRHLALGANVEVQVRTRSMHHTAELGEAAHWSYKDLIYRPEVAHTKEYKLAWRSKKQLTARSSAELFGMARQQLTASRVFVYWEDTSTVLNFKRGTTAWDAALSVSTIRNDDENHRALFGCTVLLVNGDVVSPTYILQMADVVSIQPRIDAS